MMNTDKGSATDDIVDDKLSSGVNYFNCLGSQFAAQSEAIAI